MAELSEVRLEFVKTSGRYDLLVDGDLTDNTDNGANRFVNLGQRYLDRRITPAANDRRLMAVLASGEYLFEVTGLRFIKHLFVKTSTTGVNITRYGMPIADFKASYPDNPSEWDSGQPCYWAHNVIGLAPSQAEETSETFASAGVQDYADITFGSAYDTEGLIFYPKADASYTLDLWGQFWSPTLSEDSDVSFWSTNYDRLLSLAACYEEARDAGRQDRVEYWLATMGEEISEIVNDEIERETCFDTFMGEPYDKTNWTNS